MQSDRRILWVGVANALVLFLGLVGVGVVDTDDRDSSRVSSAGATTSTTSADAAAPPSGDPAAPDQAAPGTPGGPAAAPGATATPAGGGAPAPAADGVPASRPPSDGLYRNRVVTKGEGEEDTREVKARVTTLSRTDGEVKQRTESEGEDGDGDGGGGGGFGSFSGDSDARWVRDGVYVKSDFGGDDLEADCRPPEQLQMKLPLARGVTWSNELECTYTYKTPQGDVKGRQKIRTTSTVTGNTTRSVAGKQFFVWEIFTEGNFEGTNSFGTQEYKNTGSTKTTTWFAPELGLPVLVESDVTTELMGQRGSAHSTVTLLNHTPE